MEYEIKKSRSCSGLTLLEMTISIAIVAIIFAAIVPQFRAIQDGWDSRQGSTEALQNSRILTDHINRNLSKAVRITDVSDSSTTAGYIEYEDNDGNTVRYEIASNYVRFGTVGSLSDLAGPVSQLQFTCYDACDLDTALSSPIDANDIRAVQVQATVTNSAARGQDKAATVYAYLQANTTTAGPCSLIAWWKMDETSGATAADSSTGGHTGTLKNGAAFVSGHIDNAVQFDGNNDYVEVAHSDDFLVDDGTVALWFKSDNADSTRMLFSKDSSGYDTGGHLTIYTESSRVKVRLQSTGSSYTVQSSNFLQDNTWYHMALTFGSAGMKLYVNGSLEDTDSYTGGLGTTSGGTGNYEPLAIGASTWGSGNQVITPLSYYFDGLIDDVRVYNRALTTEEVEQLSSVLAYEEFTEAKASSDATSITISTPTTNEDDLLIAAVATDGDTSSSLSPPGGEGWTQISVGANSSEVTLGTWWKLADASESSTHEFTWTGAQQAYAWMMRFTGHDSTSPIGASAVQGGSSSSPTSPAVITSSHDAIVLRLGAFDDDDITVDSPGLAGHQAITMDKSLDLVAWWKLDESSGTSAADSSGGGHSGTLRNGADFISGQINNAVEFDGGNDYIEVAHSSDFLIDDGTVTFWFNSSNVSSTKMMFSKDSSGYDTGGHLTIYNASSRVRVRLQSTGSDYTLQSSTYLQNNTWYHMALTFGSGGMKLYVNGSVEDTDSYTGGLGTTSGGVGNYEPLAIGASTWGSGNEVISPLSYYFDGVIDDVRIYNRALSSSEISDMANWGAITGETKFEFDNSKGKDPALAQIDSTHYLCAYQGPDDDGWAVVLTVDTDNWTISKEIPYEYDTAKGKKPALEQIDSTHYLCAYAGDDDHGWAVVLTVNTSNWTISKETAYEFDSSKGKTPALLRVNSTNYLCAYTGDDDDGWATVLTVDPSTWTISQNGTIEFDSGKGKTPALAQIDSTHYLCSYAGNDDDGWAVVLTVSVDGGAESDPTMGWWKLDETSGTTAADSSSSGNTGTLENMSSSAWGSGKVNGALRFDGSNDRVDVGAFDVTGGSGLTLAAWFKADDFGTSDARIISKATGTATADHYWMLSTVSSGGIKLRFRLKTSGSTTTYTASSGNLSSGTWTHAAAVWNGSQMLLYKDGASVGSTSKTGTLSTNGSVDVAIGNQPGGAGSKPFDGYIDDVRIYNRALSQAEIATLAQKTIIVGTRYEYDSGKGKTPALMQIDSTHYLCSYAGNDDDGWAVVLVVNTSNWTVSRGTRFEFDNSKGKTPALAQIDATHYLCSYAGNDDDGWATGLTVNNSNWTISKGNEYEFDTSKGKTPALAEIDSNHYLCGYAGNDDDGWAVVLSIGTASDPGSGAGTVSGGAGFLKQSTSGDSGTSTFSLTASEEARTVTIAITPANDGSADNCGGSVLP